MAKRATTFIFLPFGLFIILFLLFTLSSCGGGGGGGSRGGENSIILPPAPTALAVSLNDYFLTAELIWSPSPPTGEVTGYKIFKNGALLSYADCCQFRDPDLNINTRYCYVVKAYDSHGNQSLPSNEVCIQTQPSQSVPVSGLKAVADSSTQIHLSWILYPDNLVMSGYSIYRNGTFLTSGQYWRSFKDPDLSINTSYCYTVSAVDPYGKESAPSNQACATTGQGGDIDVHGLWIGSLAACSNKDNYSLIFYGDFQVTGSIGLCFANYIPLEGTYTINGNKVSFTLVVSNSAGCSGAIKGTGIVENDLMSGSMTAPDCLWLFNTTFNLKKYRL